MKKTQPASSDSIQVPPPDCYIIVLHRSLKYPFTITSANCSLLLKIAIKLIFLLYGMGFIVKITHENGQTETKSGKKIKLLVLKD